MSGVVEVAVALLLILGSCWILLAAVGLQRFDDVFSRMHAATKSSTLGLVLVLLGAALALGNTGDAAKLLLVILLQLVTAPVSSHMIGRATYRAGTEVAPGTTIDELAAAGIGAPHDHE